ncbi:MAG: hypothetical protein D6761_05920 [Candidatus Dadabacteria bacterium]|nr:MAG: hypothetical protein D6761_05920 [Candidatus Dadabacteria bacterium]
MTETRSTDERWNEMLQDWAEDRLRGADLAAFERKMRDDASFARQARMYRATIQACRDLPRHEMSEFGRARLQRRLQQQRQRTPALRRLARPLGYATAAVLLLTVGFATGRQFQLDRQAAAVQALPSPNPKLLLRDARTGGWLDPDTLAEQVRRSRMNFAVVPRVRKAPEAAQPDVERAREQIEAALKRHQLDTRTVQFFAPVPAEGDLLSGPEVELWVQPVSVDMR